MSLYDTVTFHHSTTPTPINTGGTSTLRKEPNAVHLLQPQIPGNLSPYLTHRLPQCIPHPLLHLLLGTPNSGRPCNWNIHLRVKNWEGGWRRRGGTMIG